jgi:hypothetical protein
MALWVILEGVIKMAIKKLSESKFKNKNVGVIGTIRGEVIELTKGTSAAGRDYANGKMIVEGSEYPTNFSVFGTTSNPDLVDQVVAACEEDANLTVFVAPEQEHYELDGKARTGLKLKVIKMGDPNSKQKDFNTLTFMGNHIEKGTVYDSNDKGSYLIFKLGVTNTWFDAKNNTDASRTNEFELSAFGPSADKFAEAHAETLDGSMVQGRVQVQGAKLILKSLELVPVSVPTEDDNDIPF